MSGGFEIQRPLPGATFGGIAHLAGGKSGAFAIIEAAEAAPDALSAALMDCGGLMLIRGMDAIAQDPQLLVRLSRVFGAEVEDYRLTLTARTAVHETVPEILVVSNIPPTSRKPPPLPDPPMTADGKLPVQYPHRRGWHTDQSYRRPSAGHLAVLCGDTSAEGAGADDVRQRHCCLRRVVAGDEAAGRWIGRATRQACLGPVARRGIAGRYAGSTGRTRAAAKTADRACAPGNGEKGALYVRIRADGLG
jgi:hypothetical protein